MSKNKFDRAPATDTIPSSVSEFSFPNSIPEVSVPEINSETEKPIKVRVNDVSMRKAIRVLDFAKRPTKMQK